MHPLRRLALAVPLAGLIVTGCSEGATPDGLGTPAASPPEACTQAERISSMPLRLRLGQLLMGGVFADEGEPAVRAAVEAVSDDSVGGVNFLGSSTAAYEDGQLREVLDAGTLPPFLAVDEEGGRVQRLADVVGEQPSARVMARTMTPAQVRRNARQLGRTMQRLSLNVDLAPVVDVSSQPDDAVIGDRSFSDDPQVVTEYAGAFAQGLRQAGVVPVLKHFPGMGSATGNTDLEPATTPPLASLRSSDLIPYESLLDDEPVAVMVANAAVPGLTGGQPATLSVAAYELLRDDFDFDGVVMTDSLSGGAISGDLPIDRAAADAIRAGADIALWDSLSEAPAILRRLQAMVRSGRLPEAQVDESVRRVLALKGVRLCAGR